MQVTYKLMTFTRKHKNGIYIYPRSHELNIHLFSYRQKCTRQFVTVKLTGVNEEQNRHQVTRTVLKFEWNDFALFWHINCGVWIYYARVYAPDDTKHLKLMNNGCMRLVHFFFSEYNVFFCFLVFPSYVPQSIK